MHWPAASSVRWRAPATLRTDAKAIWPPVNAPLQGVMELRIDDLAAWACRVPAGWRLRGALHASASFGGQFRAPVHRKHRRQRAGRTQPARGIELKDGELHRAEGRNGADRQCARAATAAWR
jgi:translocation and assembly module TamB